MIDFLKKYTPGRQDIEIPPLLPIEYVYDIIKRDHDEDKESYNSLMEVNHKEQYNFTTSEGEIITLSNECRTQFGQESLKLLQISMQSIKSHVKEDEQKLSHILLELHNNGIAVQLNENEVIGKELAIANTLYKQSNKAHSNGMDQIGIREKQLIQWSQIIQSKMSESCLRNYKLYGEGLDNLDDVQILDVEEGHWGISKISFISRPSNSNEIEVIVKNEVYNGEALDPKSYIWVVITTPSQFHQSVGLDRCLPNYTNNDGHISQHSQIQCIRNILKKLADLKLTFMTNSEDFLESKIQFIKNTVAKGLDECSMKFNEQSYFSYLQSYFYLQKCYGMEGYIDQLPKSIKRAIKSCMTKSFEEFESKSGMNFYEGGTTSQKLSQIPKEQINLFFRVVYGQMTNLMINLHLCNRFHQNYDESNQELCAIDQQYIDQKEFQQFLDDIKEQYLSMRSQIWMQIQKKLKRLLKSYPQIVFLNLQDFFEIIGYSCLIIKRAEDYSQSDSKLYQLSMYMFSLCETLENRVVEYVNHFHSQNIKNVLTYASNEEYRRLPVANDNKINFNTRDLQIKIKNVNREIFTYFQVNRIHSNSASPEKKPTDLNELFENEHETQQFYLFGYQNPFILGDEEFKLVRDAFWNKTEPNHNIPPKQDVEMVFTATSLKIYQMMHPYLVMSFYGVSLSHYIFSKYLDLVKLYVFYSFRVLVNQQTKQQMEEQFQGLLKFDENKDIEPYQTQYDSFSDCVIVREKYKSLRLFFEEMKSQDIKDTDVFNKERQEFQDITERALAIESTKFLMQTCRSTFSMILVYLKNDLKQKQNLEQHEPMERQIQQDVDDFADVMSYMTQHIKIEGITTSIIQAKWDIKETNQQLTPYLDRLIKFICDQKDKLKSLGGGVIPSQGQVDIFQNLVEYCFNLLIEAYGRIKKISPQGRDQMITEFKFISQQISQSNQDSVMPQILITRGEHFLTIYQGSVEEIISFINDNRRYFPFRMMLNLFAISPSINNLKKQQKKEQISRLFRMYNDMFLQQK